jgi:hypothetical protein
MEESSLIIPRWKMEVLSCTRFRWKIEDGRWKRLAALESDGSKDEYLKSET